MERPFPRILFAEGLATFALVLTGCGAAVVDRVSGGAISHLGVSITFGLIVMVMIYAVGDISGAHINPAVTFGFYLAKRLPGRKVGPYIAVQCIGAVAACCLLRLMFWGEETAFLGATLPTGPWWRSFLMEVSLSFLLMYVILCVTTGAKEKGMTAGITIGGLIALGAIFGGPVSGGSMNPARSLGPALVSGHLNWLWIYLIAPPLGMALSVLACRCSQCEGCCQQQGGCEEEAP